MDKDRPHPNSTVQDSRELEYQFSAVALDDVERWIRENHQRFGFELTAAGCRELEDTYLDTEGWRIYRAGYKLRVRKGGGRSEVTFKSLNSAAIGAVKERREVSQTLNEAGQDSVLTAKGLVADWLQSLAGKAKPERLFAVHTHRTTYYLERRDRRMAEIALDRCRIDRRDPPEPAVLHFVELEGHDVVQREVRRFITAMARECALQPTRLSKYGAGLSLNDLMPKGLPALDPLETSPTTGIGAFALGVVRQEFLRFLQQESGTRIGENPEDLHQMRVACRRLRAGLRVFGAYLPRDVVRCDSGLRWVSKVLGGVRDLDVKLEELHRWREESGEAHRTDFDPVMRWLRRRRDQARRVMIRALDSRRYLLLAQRLERALQRPPRLKPGYGDRAADLLPALIAPLYKGVLRTGRQVVAAPSPERYHRLRLRCKRLRYALEFAAGLYGKSLRSHRKRLVELQDLLGEYNDTVVARGNIRSWIVGHVKLPPATIFLLGILEERLRVRGETCLDEFPERFRRLTKRSWRSLEKALQPG